MYSKGHILYPVACRTQTKFLYRSTLHLGKKHSKYSTKQDSKEHSKYCTKQESSHVARKTGRGSPTLHSVIFQDPWADVALKPHWKLLSYQKLRGKTLSSAFSSQHAINDSRVILFCISSHHMLGLQKTLVFEWKPNIQLWGGT